MFAMNQLFARGSKAGSKSRSLSARLGIEALEAREVPALWLDVDGTLVYDGWHDVVKDDVSVSPSSDGGITVRYKIFEAVILPSFTIPALYADESYSPGSVSRIQFYGGLGNDKFTNNTSLPSSAYGGSGNDTLTGGSYIDNLFGEGNADSLLGGGGKDKLYGEGGKDTLKGGAGNDTLFGGSDGDKLYGEADRDSIDGGAGIDSLYGGTGNDTLQGGSDGDLLQGQADHDSLAGSVGNDSLYGGAGNDTLMGQDHADKLYGQGGRDSLQGGADNDTLVGGTGNDNLSGDGGNDKLYGDHGVPTNTIGEHDTLRGGDGTDTLYGEGGNDSLFGDRGNDSLYGGYGNDMLFGGVLDNLHTIIGADYDENGRDVLNSGPGFDRMLADDRDAILYATASDAVINFRHGSGKWTNSEVERVDAAFAILQNTTGNTRLLKLNSGGRMTFRRDSGTAAGFNDDGTLVLTDLVMNGNSTWETGYILHEIGHNWDGESSIWSPFITISGWTKSNKNSDPAYTRITKYGETWWFLTASERASNYAMTHPLDDFAESFAAYFLQQGGLGWYKSDGAGASAIPNKIALIEGWVDSVTQIGVIRIA